MFFLKRNKWYACAKKLQNNEISVQEFVNTNKNKVLYHTTPFFENSSGQHPNMLHSNDSDIVYFPVFTEASALKKHMLMLGCMEHVIIKSDLKSVLDSLDSHPLTQEWGLVIDPHTSAPIGLPPKIRAKL